MKRALFLVLPLLTWWTTETLPAQFTYATNGDSITITGYTGPGGAVTIPADVGNIPVVSIGPTAFTSPAGSQVTSVTISEGITNIADAAFSAVGYGSSLTNVTIPSSVIAIGNGAFAMCQEMETITVAPGNSVYTSPDGVLFDKSISILIFYPLGRGGSYSIPETVTNIADGAFDHASLTNVVIPNSVTSIGIAAFDGSSLTSIAVPGNVQSIGVEAFFGCHLTNATLGAGVMNIGNGAFEESGLSGLAITIPGTVSVMGYQVFEGAGVGWAIFDEGVTTVFDSIFFQCGALTNVTIPNSVTNIQYQAFAFTGLSTITIPANLNEIGDMAFAWCSNLASVYFEGNAPKLRFLPFDDDSATAYYLPGTTGWEAFSTNTGLAVVLWNPLIQTSGSDFGVSNGQFGFDITGTTNIPIVVEAATNLVNPAWIALQTFSLTNGSVYFSDPQWTNYPGRFYRISSP